MNEFHNYIPLSGEWEAYFTLASQELQHTFYQSTLVCCHEANDLGVFKLAQQICHKSVGPLTIEMECYAYIP